MINANLPDKLFGMDSQIFLLWLQPLAMAVVVLMTLTLVLVPKINEGTEKIAEIKKVDKQIAEVQQKRTYLQTVDQTEIENNAAKLASALLPEKNAYLLVRVIRNTAQLAAFNVDDFSISMGDIKKDDSEVKSSNSYDTIPVQVTLVGPTANYIALVKALERSLPIVSIESYEMKSLEETASIKLKVEAYYLREIADLKLENLTLADLTPSQKEADLLSNLSDFKVMTVEGSGSSGTYTKYERQDPFFTP